MAYAPYANQIGRRDPSLAYEDNGPGLYADERVVKLDTGDLVAVSCETKWERGNTGLALHGWARLIHPDGSSIEDPTGALDEEGRPVVFETSLTTNIPQSIVDKHGEKVLAKEVMHAVLGEPLTMVDVAVNKKGAASSDASIAPAGTTLQPTAAQVALIAWRAEVLANASIRSAIKTLKIVKGGIDPGEALGL